MNMRLEQIALWAETELFFAAALEKSEYGPVGSFYGGFDDAGALWLTACFSSGLSDEKRELLTYLKGEEAECFLRSQADLERYCHARLQAHIPYAFHRECWGFRVLTEDHAWYFACTPWNRKGAFYLNCYDRKMLMTTLALQKGLPECCYGVSEFTGERLKIRFGGTAFEVYPQYGGNANENRCFAEEQNRPFGITHRQSVAMANGLIYGWDSPMADLKNYDDEGRFFILTSEKKGKKG